MTRHLADPRVGSVTGYIKEGSRGNYLTRFIGYEYVTAQAAARRARKCWARSPAWPAERNCTRGRTSRRSAAGSTPSTLAEDTVTTFKTQIGGRRAIFEPQAVVWAEEPGESARCGSSGCAGRAATCRSPGWFRDVWFRPQPGNRLGSISFGLLWFSMLLLPVLHGVRSDSLVTLFFIDATWPGWPFTCSGW